MPVLYLVPTPIGNLEDITLRALRVLKEVSLIAAEDTRTTGRLLAHYEISTPLISYHEHNEIARLDAILNALQTRDVALVSDAGTPGLSDPGYVLIRAAIENDILVVPLPGASALLPALVASGLPTDAFTYLGFLPRKSAGRRAVIEALAALPHSLIFYEAPHRLVEALTDLHEVLGARTCAVARELTKLYEEIWRGTLEEAVAHFQTAPPRGELVVIVDGFQSAEAPAWSEADVRHALAEQLASGETRASAARTIAKQSGWERRAIYNLDL